MTVYTTNASAGGTVIRAGANDIRIIAVDLLNSSGGPDAGSFYVYTGGTLAGTSQTPSPASVGAPASTATARVAPGDSVTGGTGQRRVGGYGLNGTSTSYGVFVWQPVGDLILSSGSIFQCFGAPSNEVVWFEELRLSWSY